MNFKLTLRCAYGVVVVALAAWILRSFLHALLVACVTAIASWPLYTRFQNRMGKRARRGLAALAFTVFVTLTVLAPLAFAFVAMLGQAHALLLQIAAADQAGLPVPAWLADLPLLGPWLDARLRSELAHPGALMQWSQRADAALLLGWAELLGQFMLRHVFIIGFAILALFFFYQSGEPLARHARQLLRQGIGEHSDCYVDVGIRALRASVNSMLLVGLFDGFVIAGAYASVGVPQALVWAAITGALALVPFLGYVAVIALTTKLALTGAAATAMLVFVLGATVLFVGDKVVRPGLARGGTHLPFVWVLMGCLGGFETFGLVGLVLGPVVLTLARELWKQRVRDAPSIDVPSASTQACAPREASAL